jgi:hypothetical protein
MSLKGAPYVPAGLSIDRTAWLLFGGAFIATCMVALLVQLLVLPVFMPHLHAGHGMLANSDSAGMHSTAAALAEQMRVQGWSVWSLRPDGNASTGIAAIIYSLTIAEPYALIPLNAVVHAASGVVIYLIVLPITGNRMAAVAGAIPFLAYPSAASWYAQIHKDGIFALGMLLCLLGWMQAFRKEFWLAAKIRVWSVLLPIASGLVLAWVVKPYSVILMHPIAFITALCGIGLVLALGRSGAIRAKRVWLGMALFAGIPVLMVLAKSSDYRVDNWRVDVKERENVVQYMKGNCIIERGMLPAADKLASTIASMRSFFLAEVYRQARSTMDPEFVPATLCDLFAYLPRAIQIGFLAPFPDQWVSEGSVATGTMMRRLVSVEMIATYFALLFLPLAMWMFRRKPEFWYVLGFSILLTLVHVYLVPNLGVLYRVRYGFVMAVIGLAVGAAVLRLTRKRQDTVVADCS